MCFHLRVDSHSSLCSLQDLEDKKPVDELKPEIMNSSSQSKTVPPQCISLAWSPDGQTLYAGYTDNVIRVWQVSIPRGT